MKKLVLMSQHLFHQFTRVDHLVVAMYLQEEGVISNITGHHQGVIPNTLDLRWGAQIILDPPLAIPNTLGLPLEIQPTTQDLLKETLVLLPPNGLNRLLAHPAMEDLVVHLIHLK